MKLGKEVLVFVTNVVSKIVFTFLNSTFIMKDIHIYNYEVPFWSSFKIKGMRVWVKVFNKDSVSILIFFTHKFL